MGRETVLVPVTWEEGESLMSTHCSDSDCDATGKFPIFNHATPGRAYINMTGPLPPSRSVCTSLYSRYYIA